MAAWSLMVCSWLEVGSGCQGDHVSLEGQPGLLSTCLNSRSPRWSMSSFEPEAPRTLLGTLCPLSGKRDREGESKGHRWREEERELERGGAQEREGEQRPEPRGCGT